MPRPTRGSIFTAGDGTIGIRWPEDGRRPQQTGFANEAAARTWFAEAVLPRISPNGTGAEQREIRQWARRHRAGGIRAWVYVIVVPELGRLKIGYSADPLRRLAVHRTASPAAVAPLLMIPGDEALESKLLSVTKRYTVQDAGREWRTIEALDIVIALVRERAGA